MIGDVGVRGRGGHPRRSRSHGRQGQSRQHDQHGQGPHDQPQDARVWPGPAPVRYRTAPRPGLLARIWDHERLASSGRTAATGHTMGADSAPQPHKACDRASLYVACCGQGGQHPATDVPGRAVGRTPHTTRSTDHQTGRHECPRPARPAAHTTVRPRTAAEDVRGRSHVTAGPGSKTKSASTREANGIASLSPPPEKSWR